MHVLSAGPRAWRLSVMAVVATAALALSACGGGSDGGPDDAPPDDGSGGAMVPASIDALAGEWVQKGCLKAGAQSFKKVLEARITSPTKLDYFEGVRTFSGNECAGASTLAGPSRLGSVTFARTGGSVGLSAYWGELLTVTGTRFGAIWTLRPDNLLCLLGDEIPTNQPTLAAVSASLATVPADNCFTR